MILALVGCRALLPTNKTYTETSFERFEHLERVVASIEPGVTTTAQLIDLGIDVNTMPNVKKLTYLDVMNKFNLDSPNRYTLFNNIKLPDGVVNSLEALDKCEAYEIHFENMNTTRFGNLLIDMLGFQKNTHTTGWNMEMLLLINDGVVQYVLYSGERKIDQKSSSHNPLGPLQGLNGGDLIDAVK